MEADGEGCDSIGGGGEAAGIRRRDFLVLPDEDALEPFLEFGFHGLISDKQVAQKTGDIAAPESNS